MLRLIFLWIKCLFLLSSWELDFKHRDATLRFCFNKGLTLQLQGVWFTGSLQLSSNLGSTSTFDPWSYSSWRSPLPMNEWGVDGWGQALLFSGQSPANGSWLFPPWQDSSNRQSLLQSCPLGWLRLCQVCT